MRSVPLLLRHSLLPAVRLAKTGFSRLRPAPFTPAPPTKLCQTISARRFSVCIRCQFRLQSHLKFPREDTDRGKNATTKDGALPPIDEDPVERPNAPASSVANEAETQRQRPPLQAALGGGGGTEEYLPSQEEGRRSQTSKRFTALMDNLQSNIFTAGQRLNVLTGYSSIEQLKGDIKTQGRKEKWLTVIVYIDV
jgi:sensitive to high expression protein 9